MRMHHWALQHAGPDCQCSASGNSRQATISQVLVNHISLWADVQHVLQILVFSRPHLDETPHSCWGHATHPGRQVSCGIHRPSRGEVGCNEEMLHQEGSSCTAKVLGSLVYNCLAHTAPPAADLVYGNAAVPRAVDLCHGLLIQLGICWHHENLQPT